MSDSQQNRRSFLKNSLLGITGLTSYSLFHRVALADSPLLDETSAQAQTLGYKHDATQVDTAKWSKRAGEAGSKQFCHNCSLYQGSGTEGQGGCPIFAGKQVKAAGWCNAWVPKAS